MSGHRRERREDGGEHGAVPVRDAATVILLRPGPEVYLLRRRSTMAFAAGAHVFPGGAVDPWDTAPDIGWAGPDAAAWARTLGVAEPLARGLVCAAVRETFEESGVLLAGPDEHTVVADTAGLEEERLALIDRRLSFAEFLAGHGLVLRSDLLRFWSRWITPPGRPRRYDTRFFVAALPPGQRPRDVGGEADQAVWLAPAEALRRHERGEIALMRPTRHNLGEIAEYGDVAAVLAAVRPGPGAGQAATEPGAPVEDLR